MLPEFFPAAYFHILITFFLIISLMSYYEIENLFMAGFMVNGMQFICFRYVESLEYGLSGRYYVSC